MARRTTSSNESNATTMPVQRDQFTPDSEVTMPLGTGDFAEESVLDPLAGSATAKKLPAGVLIIVGVVVAAISGLFFMKLLSSASAKNLVNDEVTKSVDDWVAALDRKPSDDPNSTTNRSEKGPFEILNDNPADLVVPFPDLGRDPFELFQEGIVATTLPVDGGEPSDAMLARQQDLGRQKFERAGASFELKMVMGGSKPLVNLSGMIVGVGQTIVSPRESVEFTVKSIESESVVLEGRDDTINLVTEITITLDREL